jgi:hypothetical protein
MYQELCYKDRDNNKTQYLHLILAMEIVSVLMDNLMEHFAG